MSMLNVLGAGLTTALGVATGNDYLVAGGGGAASYLTSEYDKMSTSLIEEQRQMRLMDAAEVRAKNMAQFQRDLTAEDRVKEDNRWTQTFGETQKVNAANIKQSEAGIRASDSAIEVNKMQAETARINARSQASVISIQKQAAEHELKAKTDPEYMKKLAMGQIEVQNALTQYQTEADVAQIQKDFSDNPQAQAFLTTAVKLKKYGIDLGSTLGKGGKGASFTGDNAASVYNKVYEEADSNPEVMRLREEGKDADAEAARSNIAKGAVVDAASALSAVTGTDTSSPLLAAFTQQVGPIDPNTIIKQVSDGEVSVKELEASAKTPDEVKAINQVKAYFEVTSKAAKPDEQGENASALAGAPTGAAQVRRPPVEWQPPAMEEGSALMGGRDTNQAGQALEADKQRRTAEEDALAKSLPALHQSVYPTLTKGNQAVYDRLPTVAAKAKFLKLRKK